MDKSLFHKSKAGRNLYLHCECPIRLQSANKDLAVHFTGPAEGKCSLDISGQQRPDLPVYLRSLNIAFVFRLKNWWARGYIWQMFRDIKKVGSMCDPRYFFFCQTYWVPSITEWTFDPNYILEEFNFNFRYVLLWDLHTLREKWLNYLQTVETQIRRRVWSRPALFANYPLYGSPDYYGLNDRMCSKQRVFLFQSTPIFRRAKNNCEYVTNPAHPTPAHTLYVYAFLFKSHSESST